MKLTTEQQAELEHAYGYHAPTQEQVGRYAAINEAAKQFEQTVLENCPPSADRTFACRQIRDARMTANRSIALEPPVPVALELKVTAPVGTIHVGDTVIVNAYAQNIIAGRAHRFFFASDQGDLKAEGDSICVIDTSTLAPGPLVVECHVEEGDRPGQMADARITIEILEARS